MEIEDRIKLMASIDAETQGEVLALTAVVQAFLALHPQSGKLLELASAISARRVEARLENVGSEPQRKYHDVLAASAATALDGFKEVTEAFRESVENAQRSQPND